MDTEQLKDDVRTGRITPDRLVELVVTMHEEVQAAKQELDQARRRIEEGIARVAVEGRVLILTDMFGGTPSNVALSLLEPGRIDVVTGVNLPMLIKFANLHAVDGFDETVRRIAQQGRDAIQVASEVLEKRAGPEDTPGR